MTADMMSASPQSSGGADATAWTDDEVRCAGDCGSNGGADQRFDFTRLLSPMSIAAFRRDFYERQPLIRRGCPRHHVELFSLDEVETAIASAPDPLDDERQGAYGFRFNNGEREYYDLAGHGSKGRSNMAAHRALAEGYTIVANTLRHHNEAAAHLCMCMEDALQQSVDCNLYLTPPAAQGFAPHVDQHDTFLVQIAGRKTWSMWSPDQELPLSGSTREDTPPNRPPDRVIDVQAGDLLYIPHGWWHAGVTPSNDLSLHLTFGAVTLKWVDLLVEAVRTMANNDLRLRRSLPLTGADRSFEATAAEIWDTARSMIIDHVEPPNDALAQGVLTRLLADRLGKQPPPFEKRLASTMSRSTLTDANLVEVREGLRAIVSDTDDGCRLAFVGGFVNGPSEARRAFDFVVAATHFCADDLPGLPPTLRLQLVQELVLQGMVRVVPPPS